MLCDVLRVQRGRKRHLSTEKGRKGCGVSGVMSNTSSFSVASATFTLSHSKIHEGSFMHWGCCPPPATVNTAAGSTGVHVASTQYFGLIWINTMEYYSARKKGEISPSAASWADLEVLDSGKQIRRRKPP